MKKLIWGRTIFEAYRHLKRVVDYVDKLVLESCSAYSYLQIYEGKNTLEQMEAVTDLIMHKKRLVVLKKLIENAVKLLEPNDAKLLVRRYFDNVPTTQIAKEQNTTRAALRSKFKNALLHAMDKIEELGYPLETLEELLKNEGWIIGIYNEIVEKRKSAKLKKIPLQKTTRLERLINSIPNYKIS